MEVTADKNFTVNAPVEKVWELLSDPSRVVVCVQGAQLTEIVDDNNFKGKISVKIGPVTSKFNGEGRFEKLDAQAKEMVLQGAGKDTGGKGSASMTMTVNLKEVDGATEVTSSIKLSITGKLAQFGSRMIVAVNDKLIEQFVAKFREVAEGDGETAAAPATAAPVTAAPAATSQPAAAPATPASSADPALEGRVAELEATVKRLETQIRVMQTQLNAEEPEPVNGLQLVGSALKGMFGKK
ncbi:MAG: SRPBCC family protein [Deltaproteobacteria bacterium]